MKQYKVEAQNFTKGSFDEKRDMTVGWAQATISRYVADGWSLASTDATSYAGSSGSVVYMYLYFERED